MLCTAGQNEDFKTFTTRSSLFHADSFSWTWCAPCLDNVNTILYYKRCDLSIMQQFKFCSYERISHFDRPSGLQQTSLTNLFKTHMHVRFMFATCACLLYSKATSILKNDYKILYEQQNVSLHHKAGKFIYHNPRSTHSGCIRLKWSVLHKHWPVHIT